MSEFKNPSNGHRESVTGWASLWVLLFGGLYLIFKGLWAHVLIWLVAGVGLSVAMGVPIPAMIASIIYAVVIKGILENKYRNLGWIEVGSAQDVQNNSRADAPSPKPTGAISSADELQKLADLKSKGILTQEEFDAQKAKLLQ